MTERELTFLRALDPQRGADMVAHAESEAVRAHGPANTEIGRPISELRATGLLWLINTTVFHPRGYALALHVDADDNVTGWSLQGDGTERWAFAEEGWPEGQHPDDAFRRARELLR